MSYKVIREVDPDKFEAAINALLLEGYEPVGGLSVVQGKLNWVLYQAMYKPLSPP